MEIKCKYVPGPKRSAGSGSVKGIRCPINVCRINTCLKRKGGKGEGRKEVKSPCRWLLVF